MSMCAFGCISGVFVCVCVHQEWAWVGIFVYIGCVCVCVCVCVMYAPLYEQWVSATPPGYVCL